MKTVGEFIEHVGGSLKLAVKFQVHQYTVDRWRINGIPQKYWAALCKSYKVTPGDLYIMSRNSKRVKQMEAESGEKRVPTILESK